ncbi:unnamed protein product [Pneumocystis jirovecii]|uniref:Uncharacterized protein n=1 Tax=Pneumocystis jirovecii TaxID=42068 RepID=L0PAK2_PNEJI|nr:unnamed protein product [Pneumocystis jirovecii]CCJ28665.1 unnamed protein product [Pneumocystis jirovecii]
MIYWIHLHLFSFRLQTLLHLLLLKVICQIFIAGIEFL